jgi:hypothetical protein
MRKRVLFTVISIIVISIFLTAAAPAFTKLSRLTVWNRTKGTAYIKMKSTDGNDKPQDKRFYYLTIKPGLKVFTVDRRWYEATIYACDGDQDKDLNLHTDLRLTIPFCGSMPAQSKEPTFIKARFLYAVDN